MLGKTEGTIKNVQSRDTGNSGEHKTQDEDKQTQLKSRKLII
jgi:hypothetical protein